MNAIRLFAAALSLTWLSAFAFDPSVDLRGAEAVARGQCTEEDLTYVCFILKKDNKFYMALVDNRGPLKVYEVPGLKTQYRETEMTTVWERPPERKPSGTPA